MKKETGNLSIIKKQVQQEQVPNIYFDKTITI